MFFHFSSRLFLLSILSVGFSVDLVAAATLTKEATFYSDAFEGGSTANSDIFHQSNHSAAICDIPLGRFLYVSKWGTGIVIKANDRPNCTRYPNVIDFSRSVFSLFAPTSLGRISDVQVTDIGVAPADHVKWLFPKDIFSHLGVNLISSVPNILFINQGIEIRGKVTSPSDYVIVYISHEDDPDAKESNLVKVGKDGVFSARILLPKKIGNYTFVIARGKSFNTDSYATLTLIDPESLTYPSFPTEKLRLTPRITNIGNISSINLPENIFGELTLRNGKREFQTKGTTLILKDTGFQAWPVQAQIRWYNLSTTSPLDRKSRINSLFSGSVILDRKHESIGADKVSIIVKNNNANIRFITPKDFLLRPNYYITLPSGDVKEYTFHSEYIGSDKYLKQGATINIQLSLPQEGNFMLEIVRQDGIAYVNIPIARWNIWSIIDPLADIQIRTIRKNVDSVRASILDEINILRKNISKAPVTLDHTLSTLAQAKVDDMIMRNYQSHADPDGKYIDALAQKLILDIEWGLWENIWYGNVSDLALQDGLEESWVHRYNMLQSSWRRVGIGYGIKNDKVYLVHVFGE